MIRQRIITEGLRIDGRKADEIRPLSAEVTLLPRAHGTGLFQRGETQVLSIATLGMMRMEQMIDTIDPEESKRYMHHYNFPPFSTGETGFMRGPKRREIGHGALAERALLPVIPSEDEFPYALRVVSEVLSSNGSTSMASVCGSTLSLMDAGVPIYDLVAGIAMGLIHEGGEYVTLTDILGAEDAYGDMDFKVAGTKDFVTALQLDTKLTGIPSDVLVQALEQAKRARMQVLDVIKSALPAPRTELSPLAPHIITIQIPVDKIGEVIGPKGKKIKEIQEETGAEIDIQDDGRIFIASKGGDGAERASERISEIANPVMPEVGTRYMGKVAGITDFGAFVSIPGGKDGLLHVSKLGLGKKRIGHPSEVLEPGQEIEVQVMRIDERAGKISLAPIDPETGEAFEPPERPRGEGGDRDRGRPRPWRTRPGPWPWRLTRPGPSRPRPWRPSAAGGRLRSFGNARGVATGAVRANGSRQRHPHPHRADARGPLGDVRSVGRCRLARRAAGAVGRDALPRASAVQGNAVPLGEGHRRSVRRGRRRRERLHREGVHLLLRANARRRSADVRRDHRGHAPELAPA